MARFTGFVALWLAALALFTSCGSGGGEGDETPVAGTPAATTSATPAQSESAGVLVAVASQPVAFDFAPDGRLFFTERTSGEIRIATIRATEITAEVAASPPVIEALRLVAEQANTDVAQIELLAATPRDWPDSCLGLGVPDQACAEILTPGYEILAQVKGSAGAFVYRTDEGVNVQFDRLETVAAGSSVFAVVEVFQGSECGLLGIALDPDFETNHYVYVYATRPVAGRDDVGRPAILRYTDVGGEGTEPTEILTDLPETNPRTCAHVSGNVHFGPDGFLYVSVGNFEFPETSADLAQPTGKMLRVSKTDGAAAPGNPLAGSPGADPRIFAFGLRNPFDFAFHPQTGKVYAPDNGPGNCDELNIIEAGADYGVPASLPPPNAPSCLGLGGVDPIHLFAKRDRQPEEFGSNVAPAGVAFLTGDRYGDLGEGLLVCQFTTQRLQWLQLAPPAFDRVAAVRGIADCSLNVEVFDGTIYYSNTDGIFELPPQPASDVLQPTATEPAP